MCIRDSYVGTMPGGEVWSVDSQSGKSRKIAKIENAETIWSLALGKANNTLYAGTGPKGLLYKINTSSGKAELVFESNDKRILSLLAMSDGTIWMGTSDQALVFRYDPKTKSTRALADFAGNEVTALNEYRGDVVALVNDLEPSVKGMVKSKESLENASPKKNTGHQPKTPKANTGPGTENKTALMNVANRKGARKGKGSVFRISGDGHLTQLHSLTQTYFSSLAVANNRQIFAGSAEQGRLYLIEEDQSVSTAFDVDQRFIAQILWSQKSGLSFITGDASALYRGSQRSQTANYVSKVMDAKTPARFGNIEWQSGGKVVLLTRTGNTAKPGSGWSGWQPTHHTKVSAGEMRRGKVSSPPGRYFQFKATFNANTDVLRHVRLYFLPRNKPTKISEITVKPKDGQKKLRTLQTGVSKPRSPIFNISWKVENEDKDNSNYALHSRLEGQTNWRHINQGIRLSKTNFDWNTETTEDGYYRIRLSTSDHGGNDEFRALNDQHMSPLLLIDNTKPTIKNISIKYPSASAIAQDDMSVVVDAAYSIDDGPWQLTSTSDGLFDDTVEMLKIPLPKSLPKGQHTLAIRAADERGNIATAHGVFKK